MRVYQQNYRISSLVTDVTILFYDKNKERSQGRIWVLISEVITRKSGHQKRRHTKVGFFAKTCGKRIRVADMNQEQEAKLEKLLVYVQLLRRDVREIKGKLALLSDDDSVGIVAVPSSQGDDETVL